MPWQYLPSSKMHNSLVGKSLRCARLGKYVFQIFIRHVKSQSFCHTFSTSSLMRSWSIVVASMHGPVDTFFSVSPLSYVSVCYGGCRSFHYYYHLLSAGFVDDEEVISDSQLPTNALRILMSPLQTHLNHPIMSWVLPLSHYSVHWHSEWPRWMMSSFKCAENYNCLIHNYYQLLLAIWNAPTIARRRTKNTGHRKRWCRCG